MVILSNNKEAKVDYLNVTTLAFYIMFRKIPSTNQPNVPNELSVKYDSLHSRLDSQSAEIKEVKADLKNLRSFILAVAIGSGLLGKIEGATLEKLVKASNPSHIAETLK